MVTPFKFVGKHETVEYSSPNRGNIAMVSISDLHFGAFSPNEQLRILREQFLSKILYAPFNILSINGDLFHHKFMSNSDAVLCATLFISDCVELCRAKGATLLLLSGTEQHDAGQLQLFYHYLSDETVDVRIIERLKFEYVRGAKILCIPEEYGKGVDYYSRFLFHSGSYDMAIMHGMYEGAVYTGGAVNLDETGLDSKRAPTFNMSDFINCRGPILSGHIHMPCVLDSYFYYCGSPYRWQHGEEQDKGFLITYQNLDRGGHYTHFEPIESMKFITLNINDIICNPPEEVIKYIDSYKKDGEIDYLRIVISELPDPSLSGNLELIKKYYRSNNTIRIKDDVQAKIDTEQDEEIRDKYNEYQFIFDKELSEYEILAKYINHKEECVYITSEELIDLLKD